MLILLLSTSSFPRSGLQTHRYGLPRKRPSSTPTVSHLKRRSSTTSSHRLHLSTRKRFVISYCPPQLPHRILPLKHSSSISEQRRLQQLFHAEELGDRKPTQLLRRMQQLMGEQTAALDNSFLRQLFLQRLPSYGRMVLASTSATELQEIAQVADKIMDVATPSSVSSFRSNTSADIEHLKTELTELRRLFESFMSTNKHHGTAPDPSDAHRHITQLPLHLMNRLCAGTTNASVTMPRDAVHLAPSRRERPLVATNASGQSPNSRLFFISDRNSSYQFLVDTGAEVSLLPPRLLNVTHPRWDSVYRLPIATFGKRSLTLDLHLRRSLPWEFIIADVRNPILGADFLSHISLLVDVHHQQLIDRTTCLAVQGVNCQHTPLRPVWQLITSTTPFQALLEQYPSITCPSAINQPVKHSVTHSITTSGPSILFRTRRLAPARLNIAR